jgi:hypothetical protein
MIHPLLTSSVGCRADWPSAVSQIADPLFASFGRLAQSGTVLTKPNCHFSRTDPLIFLGPTLSRPSHNPKQTIRFNGVILQGQTNAQGYFLGSNQSGIFTLGPP